MKVNHTYETIIKNKLDQLNGPDSDIMWGDMKGILDVHMPQKKKRRFIGWWFFDGGSGMYLGIAILITLGSLTGYRILKSKENIPTTSIETQSVKQLPASDKKIGTGSENKESTEVTTTGNTSIKASSSLPATTGNVDQLSGSQNSSLTSSNNFNNKFTSRSFTVGGERLNNKVQNNSGHSNSNYTIDRINSNQHQLEGVNTSGNHSTETAVALYNSESFNSLLSVKPQFQISGISKTAYKKPVSEILAKINNRPHKKGWVVGGSFNYHMPLNEQDFSTLNLKGKKGNLVDYLPSVYIQYHLNDKLYLQSEVQYSSPQHTPNHVLFDEWNNMTTHQKEENLVYLDKLYYLNIPITLHYSPFKNIQLGSGIQVSHLVKSILTDEQAVWQNGMEGWQKTIVNTQVYSKSPGTKSSTGSMPARVDTALQSFKSNDLRMVMDANYNLGKLNVGFSFNIGLTNYLNSKAGVHSIQIKDRNEDLKIYLRYKLWDQRKKKVTP